MSDGDVEEGGHAKVEEEIRALAIAVNPRLLLGRKASREEQGMQEAQDLVMTRGDGETPETHTAEEMPRDEGLSTGAGGRQAVAGGEAKT